VLVWQPEVSMKAHGRGNGYLGKQLIVFVGTFLLNLTHCHHPHQHGRRLGQDQGHMTWYGCYDGIQVKLAVGNIANQQVQAVVSAANGELKPRGGVAVALSKKRGALF
jgi:hypothetical protein